MVADDLFVQHPHRLERNLNNALLGSNPCQGLYCMDGGSSLTQPQLHVLGVSDYARLLSPDVFITIFAIDRLSLVFCS